MDYLDTPPPISMMLKWCIFAPPCLYIALGDGGLLFLFTLSKIVGHFLCLIMKANNNVKEVRKFHKLSRTMFNNQLFLALRCTDHNETLKNFC